MNTYYSTGKKGSLDGVPVWRPKWWGELGNDAEFREATKPRGFKGAYYAGGYRLTIDGVPIRLAAHVKGWKPGNKAALCKGFHPGTYDWSKQKIINPAVARDLFAAVPAGQLRIAA